MYRGGEDVDDYGANIARHDEDKHRRQEIENIFKMMDTDHDGYLSPAEALRVGRMLGVAIPERHTTHVKGVSMAQFLGWLTSLGRPKDGETEVVRFFTFMKDKNGFITRARLHKWLDANKVQLSTYELNELMDIMNSTDDERGICYDDLRNFYEQSRRR